MGDLSRSFSALLSRLGQHHSYLETWRAGCRTKLRTPIAVVRSSLENLHLESMPESAQTYISRAEAGLGRLTRILARMSEASRMEQSLATTDPERFDLRGVVSEVRPWLSHGSPGRDFIASLPRHPVWVSGAPIWLRSCSTSSVDNAGDFALPDTPIRVDLAFDGPIGAVLAVSNQGPQLPAELEGRLFESMVSGRAGRRRRPAHLGLGLYVRAHDRALSGSELSAETCVTACDSVRPSAWQGRSPQRAWTCGGLARTTSVLK